MPTDTKGGILNKPFKDAYLLTGKVKTRNNHNSGLFEPEKCHFMGMWDNIVVSSRKMPLLSIVLKLDYLKISDLLGL